MDAKTSFAQGQLRSFIERIERLHEEKKSLEDDLKEVYGEAKATGFDTKVMKKVVQLRKKDAAELEEEEAILDLYLSALGMAPGEPFDGAGEGGPPVPPPPATQLAPPVEGVTAGADAEPDDEDPSGSAPIAHLTVTVADPLDIPAFLRRTPA